MSERKEQQVSERERTREILAHVFAGGSFENYSELAVVCFRADADEAMELLSAAGLVMVDRGRFERLQKCGNALDVAVMAHVEGAGPALPALLYGAWKRMQPGDIDPADEPVAGEERQGRVRAIKRGELKLGNDVEAEMMADAGEVWEG